MREASSAARVRRRRGIIAERAGSTGGSEVGGGRSAVLGFQDGKNNRLPGRVV